MEPILDSSAAQFVGLAHADTTLDATAGHPHREAIRVVVPAGALGVFGCWLSSEFTAPDNQRLLEQSTLLQVVDQTGDRLVGFQGVHVMVAFQVAVSIPVGVVVIATGIDLDKSYPAFNQPPGHQTLATKVRAFLSVQPVSRLRFLGLGGQVCCLRR